MQAKYAGIDFYLCFSGDNSTVTSVYFPRDNMTGDETNTCWIEIPDSFRPPGTVYPPTVPITPPAFPNGTCVPNGTFYCKSFPDPKR